MDEHRNLEPEYNLCYECSEQIHILLKKSVKMLADNIEELEDVILEEDFYKQIRYLAKKRIIDQMKATLEKLEHFDEPEDEPE